MNWVWWSAVVAMALCVVRLWVGVAAWSERKVDAMLAEADSDSWRRRVYQAEMNRQRADDL